LGTIALNAALMPSLKDVDPSVRRWLSIAVGVVLISAIPAGVLALAGIRKHGRRGLLWKGLLGAILPAMLIAMAVPAFLKVKNASLQRQIANVVSDINQCGPQKVDDVTRLDRAVASGNQGVEVYFTITGYKSSEIDMSKWEGEAVPSIKSGIKDSILGALLAKGANVKYIYAGAEGDRFAEINFDPKEYKK
jgi:hypothetical protein